MKFKTKVVLLLIILAAILIYGNIKRIGRFIYPIKYSDYIFEYSEKYDLNPYFVAAIIKNESNYDNKATSHKSAYGLMQITDSTGRWAAEKIGIENYDTSKLYDPEFNINVGCWYMNYLKGEFNGNVDLMLAAYNGGIGNVKKWLKDSEHSHDGKSLSYIPFKETDLYVKKVKVSCSIYKYLYENKK